MKIESIRIEHKPDTDPDLSWIGEFTDNATDNAIIRHGEHAGKLVSELGEDDKLPGKSREYRFFVPAMTGEETGDPDSPKQDWQRMEGYNSGQWSMIGVVAKAEIVSPNGIIQTIRSGGLWGVESDSGADNLLEIAKEQLAELKAELLALNGGLSERAIDRAIKNCDTEN